MSIEDFEKQKRSLFELINSWDEKNIRLATLIWQGNKELKEATHKAFGALLQAKNYKSLLGLKLLSCLNGMDCSDKEEKVQYLMKIRWLEIHHADLERFPECYKRDLEQLKIQSSSLRELPGSIGELLSLKVLDLSGCRNLQKIPTSIQNLKHLQTLNLRGTILGEKHKLQTVAGANIQAFFKKIFHS